MPGNEWLSKLEDVADQVSIKIHQFHLQMSLIHKVYFHLHIINSKINSPISLSNNSSILSVHRWFEEESEFSQL